MIATNNRLRADLESNTNNMVDLENKSNRQNAMIAELNSQINELNMELENSE